MMKNKEKKIKIGIVVEYNPFHNGHIHQLNFIKNKFPNSKIYVAMSHKFSQRGEYICASWNKRKRIAKKYGVDSFVKLRSNISTQAAHIFANEAVKLLNKRKVDYLVFGSETDDITVFLKIAYILKHKKDQYDSLVKKFLKKGGNSFPKASNLAVSELTNFSITTPNDILGIEYVKSIVNNNFNIKPICIKRTVGFHSDITNQNFASATKLRQMIENGEDISDFSPMKIKKIKKIDETYEKFQRFIRKSSPMKIKKYKLVEEGIENLFKKNIEHKSYSEFIDSCVSKRYTKNRIKRTYLSILLKEKK
nr:nucleotidyltransferase [Mycoplasmopsis canis]WQQ12732.1 nucleotidyltransferase [Mycoplasmopsis canis]